MPRPFVVELSTTDSALYCKPSHTTVLPTNANISATYTRVVMVVVAVVVAVVVVVARNVRSWQRFFVRSIAQNDHAKLKSWLLNMDVRWMLAAGLHATARRWVLEAGLHATVRTHGCQGVVGHVEDLKHGCSGIQRRTRAVSEGRSHPTPKRQRFHARSVAANVDRTKRLPGKNRRRRGGEGGGKRLQEDGVSNGR